MSIYFDHASTSHPKPLQVAQEISSYLTTIGASPGRGNYALADSAYTLIEEVRNKLAIIVGAEESEQICFTHNATHAINIVLKGLLKKDDHVIISNFEHNAVLRPLHKLSEELGITYSIWESNPDGFFDINSLEAMIQPTTKLLVLNHASNVIGILSPVIEVARRAKSLKIPLLVDVSQTAGIFPIHFEGLVDYIAGTGHKSLLGPPGVGFLYVKEPDTISSLYEGGSGHHSLSPYHPEAIPDKFEAGTLNYLGISGLKGSLSYIENYGQEKIRKKALELTHHAILLLKEIPGVTLYGAQKMEYKVPLFSFTLNSLFPSEVGYALNQQGISVRCGLHCAPLIHRSLKTLPHGTVRVSLGHQNTFEELKTFCKVIESIELRRIS